MSLRILIIHYLRQIIIVHVLHGTQHSICTIMTYEPVLDPGFGERVLQNYIAGRSWVKKEGCDVSIQDALNTGVSVCKTCALKGVEGMPAPRKKLY